MFSHFFFQPALFRKVLIHLREFFSWHELSDVHFLQRSYETKMPHALGVKYCNHLEVCFQQATQIQRLTPRIFSFIFLFIFLQPFQSL